MPKQKNVGGRGYLRLPDKQFVPHASNTICDVTGFRVKTTEVMRRWEGFMVIKEAWHPRQPQDFPVVPQKTVIYKEARKGNADEVFTVTPNDFTVI